MLHDYQVIVITHSHPPSRVGIRWLVPGLKVYHVPLPVLVSGATLPNYLAFLPWLRPILLRERITLIHGHASLSSLAHEAIMNSHLFGIRTVFTDHSLFALDDAAGILTNKLLAAGLCNVGAVICVSHTGYASGPTSDAILTGTVARTLSFGRRYHQRSCMSSQALLFLNSFIPRPPYPQIQVSERVFDIWSPLDGLQLRSSSCLALHIGRAWTCSSLRPRPFAKSFPTSAFSSVATVQNL